MSTPARPRQWGSTLPQRDKPMTRSRAALTVVRDIGSGDAPDTGQAVSDAGGPARTGERAAMARPAMAGPGAKARRWAYRQSERGAVVR